MRKRWWVLLMLSVIATLIFATIHLKIMYLKKDVTNYLVHEKRYAANDIYSIETKISTLPTFPMYVIFQDEPHQTYMYTDRGVGQWTQLFPNEDVISKGGQFKHWENPNQNETHQQDN
ncbi:DUF3139 domain-containing protein [Paenibacillus sp. WLX1005]|uniref:DUF3139 domain-containing protein n=1 Tax=Paenibacillus sp. WLX1005 TaxID=3243766 RepID=UPI0039845A8D